MTLASDPNLAADPRLEVPHVEWRGGALSRTTADAPLPVAVGSRTYRSRRVWGIYAALCGVTVLLALRMLASALAVPLDSVVPGIAPTWNVELTTSNSSTGTALIYGREAGFQLVSVPAKDDESSARIVPARLAKGELHIISLGMSPLSVHAASPKGAEKMSFWGTARNIVVFQKKEGTGVRVGW